MTEPELTDREMDELEDQIPAIALKALAAASKRAATSGLPRVLVIDNGLYHIDGSGTRELIRMLPMRTGSPDHDGNG